METTFSTINFIEPTDEFKKEFFDVLNIKEFFNMDLIAYSFYYKDVLKDNNLKLDELERSFNGYVKFYNLQYSLLEIYEMFKDWTENDLTNFMAYYRPIFLKNNKDTNEQ